MWFPKPMHLYTRRNKSHLSNSCFPFIFRCRSWEETNISKPGFDVFPAFDDRSSFSVANWSTQWWYNFISRFQFNQRNTLIKRYPLDSKKVALYAALLVRNLCQQFYSMFQILWCIWVHSLYIFILLQFNRYVLLKWRQRQKLQLINIF